MRDCLVSADVIVELSSVGWGKLGIEENEDHFHSFSQACHAQCDRQPKKKKANFWRSHQTMTCARARRADPIFNKWICLISLADWSLNSTNNIKLNNANIFKCIDKMKIFCTYFSKTKIVYAFALPNKVSLTSIAYNNCWDDA